MAKKEFGKIHNHTGDGHGKTTSALGMGLRAIGHDYVVIVVQFMKGWKDVGEVNISKQLENMTFYSYGTGNFFRKGEESSKDIKLAKEGFAKIVDVLENDKPDLLILDELNVAVFFNLLDVDEVVELLNKYRNKGTEIIVTGRRAHKKLIEVSDIATEMKLIKHYYDHGVEARKGVEY